MSDDLISSITQYLQSIDAHLRKHWTIDNLRAFVLDVGQFPVGAGVEAKLPNRWFRGQAQDWALLPKAYRHPTNEQQNLLDARRRAALLPGALSQTDIIGWYFLLQHHGMATRLIDWTESALVGLYFAVSHWKSYLEKGLLSEFKPTVWMLHPNAFNWAMRATSVVVSTGIDEATYNAQDGHDFGLGKDNILAAWQIGGGPRTPIALTGAYVDVRMQVQRGQFTAHGSDRIDLREQFDNRRLSELGFVRKFLVDPKAAKPLLQELYHLGVSRSVLFPDLDGIAQEYSELEQ